MLWFTPKCPVEADDKLWLEESMEWLLEEFGCDAFRAVTVVLPTDEFFPDSYSADEDDVWSLVERVCAYIDVDPDLIELEFFDDQRGELRNTGFFESSYEGASGHYKKRKDKFVVSLATSQLTDPMSLVATIAHELGHVRLLGEERVDADFEDHEPLTDLLTVFFGLGVFTANSAFSFQQWTNTSSQGWQTERKGYLSEEMFGYALALFALMRNEHHPDWSRHLEGSVVTYFKNGQRYLEKTGDAARLKQLVSVQSEST
jgi:hypothetical protein